MVAARPQDRTDWNKSAPPSVASFFAIIATMKRACEVTIEHVTRVKRSRLAALLQAYRAAVNFFVGSLWMNPGRLGSEMLRRLPKGNTRLSERYKSQALNQAFEIVSSTRKAEQVTGAEASCPRFAGPAVLDAKFVRVEDGDGSFDLVVRISCLKPRERIVIPTRHTAVTRKWLARPLAKFVQGCALSEDSLILWIDLPDLPPKDDGDVLGMDIGVNKLLSTSDGRHFGREFKRIRDKIIRREPGSRGRARARRERDHFINRMLNQLPWTRLRALGVEDLLDMKRGKKKGRGKSFRKAMAPWTYRQVLTRARHKAQENRVLLVAVDPANTSRTCPVCKMVSKKSRKGEGFKCVSCLHEEDADTVGALEILDRTLRLLGSLASPRPTMSFSDHAAHDS